MGLQTYIDFSLIFIYTYNLIYIYIYVTSYMHYPYRAGCVSICILYLREILTNITLFHKSFHYKTLVC